MTKDAASVFSEQVILKNMYFQKKNQNIHYTCCNTPQLATSFGALLQAMWIIFGVTKNNVQGSKRKWNYHCNNIFIHQVALARRQRRDISILESRYHLPTCLPHTVEASHCPFQCRKSSRKAVNNTFFSLWFDPTRDRARDCQTPF